MEERCSAASLDLPDPLEALVERIPVIHVEEVVVFLVKDVCVSFLMEKVFVHLDLTEKFFYVGS